MSLLKGMWTCRRYRVDGEIPGEVRETLAAGLQAHAFRPPAAAANGLETAGWVHIHNLLETDFDNPSDYLHGHLMVASLRIDKKVLPSKLLSAHLDLRMRAWCENHGQSMVPSDLRTEMRTAIEDEMLTQTLPRVRAIDFCWHLTEHWVAFHSTAVRANDRFRTLFRTSFGVALEPVSPLEFIPHDEEATALMGVGLSDYSLREMRVQEAS